MCGIVVGLAFGKLSKKEEEIRQRVLRYLTTELMLLTEDRGKDATGAAVLFNDGDYFGLKRGEKVGDFLAKFGEGKDYYGSLLKVWRDCDIDKAARIFLGHCRQGTTGDKEENENNHPIKIGNLIGIHNGVIKNHEIIFEKLKCKRDGKVDSEAIFRLLEYYTNGGKEPFTFDMIQEVIKRLDGQFAVTVFNADNVEQVPFFRDGRPIEFVLIKSLGILLAISEQKFWKDVYYQYERLVNYNSDIFGRKLPSLLEKDNIETKMMEDDHTYIFDLTKQCDSKSTIASLSQSKRMERGKIWTAPASTHTVYSGGNYHGTGTRVIPASSSKSSTDSGQKRRVFDNIKKQYVVKIGDKVVDEDKSVVIPVDDDKAEIITGEAVVTTVNGGSEDTETKEEAKATNITEAKDVKESIEHDGEEEQSSDVATIEDKTSYENKTDENVQALRKTFKEVAEAEAAIEGKVVEVEMKPVDPQMIERSERAYRNLVEKDRGYTEIEDVLNDVDIQDAETAESLGIVILCNRVRKAGWKAGYISALMDAALAPSDGSESAKADKQERHIVNLKRLVMVLAKFYKDQISGSSNPEYSTYVNNRLKNAALNLSRIPVSELIPIFNSFEKSMVESILKVILEVNGEKDKLLTASN